jgi:hypothetical protein
VSDTFLLQVTFGYGDVLLQRRSVSETFCFGVVLYEDVMCVILCVYVILC